MMNISYFILLACCLQCVSTWVITDINDWENCIGETPFCGLLLTHIKRNRTRYPLICQVYKSIKRYGTVYDTVNMIPVYSVFRITSESGKEERKTQFAIEPQLVDINQPKDMQSFSSVMKKIKKQKLVAQDQAIPRDYRGSTKYHRGHLNPAAGHRGKVDSDATFTLTNAAPQIGTFNQGCWKHVEQQSRQYVRRKCNYYGNAVAGVVPGNKLLNRRVNIPGYFWSVVACDEGPFVVFLVPNVRNADIISKELLYIFHFKHFSTLSEKFLEPLSEMYKVKETKARSFEENSERILSKLLISPKYGLARLDEKLIENLGCDKMRGHFQCTCKSKKLKKIKKK